MASLSSLISDMLTLHTTYTIHIMCATLCASIYVVCAIFEIVLWETDGLVPIIKQTNYFIYLAFTTLTIDRVLQPK